MRLNTLSNNPGAKKNRIRVGRGIGSGKGKTCGRGTKGQKARSGVAIKGFEGGQMPIIKRLPKRGFNCPTTIKYQIVNVYDIEKLVFEKRIDASQSVNQQSLINVGLVKSASKPIKILASGNGDITTKLIIELSAYSQSAKALIEKAGGQVL
jgi:large subunit ribosomal protein L15